MSAETLTPKNLKVLEDYYKQYPFFKNDKRTNTVLASYYSKITSDYYQKNDEANGEKYFEILNDFLNESKDMIQLDSEKVAQFYLFIGRYYYGKNKFTKAKSIFEKGLAFYPEHQKLTKMLKWAIEDMK
jgi:tetratricopeptide (TPR) repeat protein